MRLIVDTSLHDACRPSVPRECLMKQDALDLGGGTSVPVQTHCEMSGKERIDSAFNPLLPPFPLNRESLNRVQKGYMSTYTCPWRWDVCPF